MPDLKSRREPHHTTVRDATMRRHARKKMEQLLSVLYGASGIAASALYVPQIIKYHRDPDARRSISLLSWGGWIAIAIVTILYALYVVKSPLFAAVAALNVTAQLVVLCYGVNARLERSHTSRSPASTISKERATVTLTATSASQ